jgi:hypothetical protein
MSNKHFIERPIKSYTNSELFYLKSKANMFAQKAIHTIGMVLADLIEHKVLIESIIVKSPYIYERIHVPPFVVKTDYMYTNHNISIPASDYFCLAVELTEFEVRQHLIEGVNING